MWEFIEPYRQKIERFLREIDFSDKPSGLYEPVRYMLGLGGKRVRPVLSLIAAEGYGIPTDLAMPAAAALEIFHNFTLVHDDIMDRAPLRRGKPAVHKRWNLPVAVLAGDVMVFLSQKFLESYSDNIFASLQRLLNRTAIEICEGQQLDMDFERRTKVSTQRYTEMIRKKTAVLLGTALQYGGILASKTRDEQQLLHSAGTQLGLAFQIADDYLDSFGPEKFGKQRGGDIREGKKTFLYVKLFPKLPPDKKENFVRLYQKPDKTEEEVETVIQLFKEYNIPLIARKAVEEHTRQFTDLINSTTLAPEAKHTLIHLADVLARRTV